ncbi:hypothetical protein CSV79_11640 [Sporosarcina sp. P13]|nr:hypothetical protein CSV79_11640 [Sporosarcina sp. P13]
MVTDEREHGQGCEPCIPLPIEPPSELLWKHDRIFCDKEDMKLCCSQTANLGGTAETKRFRPEV